MKPTIVTLAALTLCACSDDPSSPDGGTAGGPSDAGIDPEVQALYDCEETDFAVTSSLAGPGWDDEQNQLLDPTQDSYVVHTTQLILKPDSNAKLFSLTGKVIGQMMETPGFVAFSLSGSEACHNVRTMGIWESEEAMYGMVNTGAHTEAMAATTTISLSGRVTHWTATAAEVNALTWDDAKSHVAKAVPSPIYD